MNLVSVEISQSDAQKMYSPQPAEMEAPKYPYGLQIDLDQETLAKLGIKELPKVGTDMKLTAECEVVSISQNESKDGNSTQRVCLQIEMMALEPMKDDPSEAKQDPAEALYGSGS